MRVAIVGAGPAGLYCGYLLKKWIGSDVEVTIVEQNPPDATWGFGVVFSDTALAFLEQDDRETHDTIVARMERWENLTLNVQGEAVTLDGVGFTAIGRLDLLLLLQQRARSVGIEPVFHERIETLDRFAGADLIVAADGVNSIVRNTFRAAFGTEITFHPNKFIWYGTSKPFETLTQTFRANDVGEFNAHHYRYQPSMSTFLVETNEKTWQAAGFENMNEADTKAYFQELFAPELDGEPIIENASHWRNFPVMTQKKWSHENMVLVGDALHTAHFSIGSGTRLAMEDVIQLVRSIKATPHDIPTALKHYESERKPIVDKLVGAANTSLDWYTDFGSRMKADLFDFAHSYITRSGRVDDERLRKISPKFMKQYDEQKRRLEAVQ